MRLAWIGEHLDRLAREEFPEPRAEERVHEARSDEVARAQLAAEVFTVRPLSVVKVARALEPAREALPSEELWLVGHRALRTVPRVAALWDFLSAELTHPERAHELARRR